MPCLSIEAKRRIASLYFYGKALLNIYLRKCVPCMVVTRMATLCVAHGILHETCMIHTMSKHGPYKDVMGMPCSFLVPPHMDTHVKLKL